jgi:putative restriction endonuclease
MLACRAEAPYAGEVGPDGSLRYKWRGTDPNHLDNRALREAMRRHAPLAYFYPVARGVYEAIYPGLFWWMRTRRRTSSPSTSATTPTRTREVRARRLTLQRLRQVLFRPRVLRAYESSCALCRLRHPPLLGAAHILPDHHPHGDPVVPNGLAPA